MTTPAESIENALSHHAKGGRIKSFTARPSVAQRAGRGRMTTFRWSVVLTDGQQIELSPAGARAFCYALASAEQGARKAVFLAQVDETPSPFPAGKTVSYAEVKALAAGPLIAVGSRVGYTVMYGTRPNTRYVTEFGRVTSMWPAGAPAMARIAVENPLPGRAQYVTRKVRDIALAPLPAAGSGLLGPAKIRVEYWVLVKCAAELDAAEVAATLRANPPTPTAEAAEVAERIARRYPVSGPWHHVGVADVYDNASDLGTLATAIEDNSELFDLPVPFDKAEDVEAVQDVRVFLAEDGA